MFIHDIILKPMIGWAYNSLFGTLAAVGGGLAAGALLGRRKVKGGGFSFQPYGGLRPPRIDTEDTKIFRPTQKQIFDILMRRSQGEDVGYDPARRTAQEDLLRSNLAKVEEDRVRDAQGVASAAGLSGNLRAQEAMAGRVRRDVDRSLSEGLTQITIEDLERANQERDINTARLQDLNTFNFGQENRAADFDLNVYNAEQGNRLAASNVALANRQAQDQYTSDLVNTGIGLASMGMPQQSVRYLPAASSATSGTGILPILPSKGMYSGMTLSGDELAKRRLGTKDYMLRKLTGQ